MLQLLGTNDSRIEIDPAAVSLALVRAPAVQADLRRLDLGSVREIVGTFIASAPTLARASRSSIPVSDDLPLQEYSVRSLLNFDSIGVPPSVVDLSRIREWCPRCFAGEKLVAEAEGLDTYLAVLGRAYMVPLNGMPINFAEPRTRQMIKASAYLDTLIRSAATVRNDLGVNFVSEGRVQEAIDQFEEALRLEPELRSARRNLTSAQQVRSRTDASPEAR